MKKTTCSQLRLKLSELKNLKIEFDLELGNIEQSKSASTATRLQSEIQELIKKLNESFHVSIERAKEIMGSREVLGPKEIEKAYGIKLVAEIIPPIPFSRKELEIAMENGQFLVLRSNVDHEGNPLTMERVRTSLLANGFNRGKITFMESYGSEDFWQNDPIELRWALVSKEVIPGSDDGKNYFEQTKQLVDYVKNEIFNENSNTKMPPHFLAAIIEFNDYVKKNFSGKTEQQIEELLGGSDWRKYAQQLADLKINQLTRQTPAETLYDIFIYYENNNEKFLKLIYTWTKRLDFDGLPVKVGSADNAGADASGREIDSAVGGLGVVFSRS
jgi:hypothetical protein